MHGYMSVDVSGVKSHHCFPIEHLFERKDSTSQKLHMCFLFCCFTRMEGHTVMSIVQMVIIYIYTRRLFQKTYNCFKELLLHSLFFNPLIHNCVKVHRKLYTNSFQQILHRQQALELPKIYQGIGIKKGLRTCCVIHTSACLL